MTDRQNTMTSSMTADLELRVLVQGLQLDDTTRALIDAAIRSAVLQELATIDTHGTRRISSPQTDPQTRSILGNAANKVLGLVVKLV
jgi:hypothetical protein